MQLTNFKTFLVDLDGTFYLGETLFPWSASFVKSLADLDKRLIFVTNNSSRSQDHYVNKIDRMGIKIRKEQVYTSGQATIFYLKKNNFPKKLYLIGTAQLEQEFIAAGFILTATNPQAVVLGFDLTLTYEKLRTACDLIRKGVPFIATHPDLNCPTPEGPIPDCGSMIALITASTGVKPIIIGKPYPFMVEALQSEFGLKNPTAVAMIGDRLYTDMAMAKAAGIGSILVLSGETSRADLEHSFFQPDFVFENLGELTTALLQVDWENGGKKPK